MELFNIDNLLKQDFRIGGPKPMMLNTSPIPLFFANKNLNKGGKIRGSLPLPIADLDILMSASPSSNIGKNVLGSLAGVVLPVITSFIIKKLFEKGKDKKDIKEIKDISEDIKDIQENIKDIESDDLDIESESLLNRILGRGILEIN